MEKNCEAKDDIIETSQNQNGDIFSSNLKMQQKSSYYSWPLITLDFYSTCKYSLTNLCMLLSLNAILFDKYSVAYLTRLKSHLICMTELLFFSF